MKFRDEILMMGDEEYREIDTFSYSSLKSMEENGPLILLSKEKKTGPALEFGSLVDILITDPESKDTKFHTKTVDKPTASTLVLADALVMDHLLLDKPIEEIMSDEYVFKTIRNLKIWEGTKNTDKLKEKYENKTFRDYVTESIKANGKIVISEDTLNDAIECANVLTTHPYTAEYFTEKDGLEIIKQPSIIYEFEGVTGKARIDLLHVNHSLKTISIMDIKTGSELPSKFQTSFYKFRYYLQVISYLGAISYVLNRSKNFHDYKINSFQFLYLSKKMPLVPTIHTVEEKHLDRFMNGWITQTGEHMKGFKELVQDYAHYRKTNIYSVEREVIQNDGKFNIKLI